MKLFSVYDKKYEYWHTLSHSPSSIERMKENSKKFTGNKLTPDEATVDKLINFYKKGQCEKKGLLLIHRRGGKRKRK